MSIAILGTLTLILGLPANLDEGIECTKCQRVMQDDWNFCPYDAEALKLTCPKCEKVWDSTFDFCPKDTTPLRDKAGKEAVKKTSKKAPLRTNTPMLVVDEFVEALRSADAELLGRLIDWESYHEAYLSEQSITEKDLSQEDFRKKVLKKFINEKVSAKIKGMIRSQDGNIYKIVGGSARIQVTLVNPEDPKERFSNILNIRDFSGTWRITGIN
ncbi:MAG: zinc ribbon domain-containing protein [Planctomycetota bacterium]|nr:zinc ribbon domain-containing protein [Planctomycetota bacterium]